MDQTLPDELKDQLGDGNPDRTYTKHELVLGFIVHNEEAAVDELLIYLWMIHNKVTQRSYLYSVLKRLRDNGLINSVTCGQGKSSLYYPTELGRKRARPFLPVGKVTSGSS